MAASDGVSLVVPVHVPTKLAVAMHFEVSENVPNKLDVQCLLAAHEFHADALYSMHEFVNAQEQFVQLG